MHKPKDVQLRTQLLRLTDHTIWIPDIDTFLKNMRFLVASHTSCARRRSYWLTFSTLIKHFKLKNIQQYTKALVESFIHFLSTRDCETIPGPLEHVLHATKHIKMRHFDYWFMEQEKYGYQSVLIINDEQSGYLSITLATERDSDSTISVVVNWLSTFDIGQT